MLNIQKTGNSAKKRKTLCECRPYRTYIISGNVWVMGAFRFRSRAIMEKSMTWMDAPAAYQNEPAIPNSNVTVEDCNSVAAQVQADTMDEAMRPVLMVRPAV